jgi:imidazolonepropionase-like amidohydrolase
MMPDIMELIVRPKRFIALLGFATLAACAESPAPPSEPASLAIVGAQLIDGTGGDPVPDSVIVIRDGRVQAAGPRDTTAVPQGAEIIDATGKTIIPGLVDLHAHYGGDLAAAERALRAQLYYGVTTTRSIGSDDPAKVALMLEANAGRPDLPRAFTAGRGFSHPNGFNAGTANTPASEEEARELVREQAALGAHFVKMWVNDVPDPGLKITPEIRAAIVDEAIKNGLIPVAHIDEEADGMQLIEAGLKDFLHSTVRTFGPGAGVPMDDPEVSDEFLQLCLDNGCAFTPTLSVSQNNWHFAEHPELLEDPELRAVLNPAALASFDDPETRANIVGNPGFEDRKAAFRQVQAFVKQIYDAGIPVALGTDSGTRNVPMGWGTHHELELYVEAGLTPMQALVAATATGASLMPPVGEADFGMLEAGKSADLIVLDADPLTDIRNTLEIDQVMQRGEWVERDGLLPTP